MEQLSTKVSSIERSLGRIDHSLTTHKQNAQKEVGSDVAAIGEALQQGQHEIEHVSSELQSFLTAVDDHPQSKQVVLKPQIEWLSRNVTSILGNLEKAERKTSLAMEESMSFQSSVGDSGQEIAVQERELSEARTEGKDLEARAQRDLTQSLKLIDEAESEIASKNWQISNKQREASSLRSELSTHRSELSSLETQVANARARASRKKDKAVGGGVGLLPNVQSFR
jgi:chromosome segregation ATPase